MRNSFLGNNSRNNGQSTLWHDLRIFPVATRRHNRWMGFTFGHSVGPIGILLFNNLGRMRKSRVWDPGAFLFTRTHVRVGGLSSTYLDRPSLSYEREKNIVYNLDLCRCKKAMRGNKLDPGPVTGPSLKV